MKLEASYSQSKLSDQVVRAGCQNELSVKAVIESCQSYNIIYRVFLPFFVHPLQFQFMYNCNWDNRVIIEAKLESLVLLYNINLVRSCIGSSRI